MKRFILSAIVSLFAVAAIAETPLWMRDVRISPDGKEIVFCYKGDIYRVAATGGTAIRLTTADSYECYPVWSPDCKTIAFASDRNGNYDIFTMSVNGGAAKRLTFDSASEIPWAFSNDGKKIYFSSSIQDPAESAMFPYKAYTELYEVPAEGGRTIQVLATPAEMICFDKSGQTMLYQDRKGGEDEWRKHHTSSVTRDIWSYDFKTGKHVNLTAIAGEDRNPVFSPDGKSVYFLSERNGGTFNVYVAPLDDMSAPKAVTKHKNHPVRFLSIAPDGTLCYTYDGEIYTMSEGKEKKVAIDVLRDDAPQVENLAVRMGRGVVSPDGKQVAFAFRGNVFVTSVDYPTTKQITFTPERENDIAWAADSRSIVYCSERNGGRELFRASIARDDEPNFPNATLINEEAILPGVKVERESAQFSPDGKELAFLQDRDKLMVLNLDTKKVRMVTDGSQLYGTSGSLDYSWSPDGKWFVMAYTSNHHEPYSNIGIVSANGGKIVDITGTGYFDQSPRWSSDGSVITFLTDRYGMRSHASWGSLQDVMAIFLTKDAYDKFCLSKEDYELLKEVEKGNKKPEAKKEENKKEEAKKDIVIDFDGIQDRLVRLTATSSNINDAILSKDGTNLYYVASYDRGGELWKVNARERNPKVIAKASGSLDMDSNGNIYICGQNMQRLDAKSDALKPITATATMKIDYAAEREYMYNHVLQQEQKRFYVETMHGCDWKLMGEAYRKFLPHINNNYDFAELLSEILGELNTSHTGGRYSPRLDGDATASLGLLYDYTYRGKGFKVTEVLAGGPFDRKNSKVAAGDIIEKVNDVVIDEKTDYASPFNGIAKKKTLISFYRPSDGSRWDEVVLPIGRSAESALLYKRWVKRTEEKVKELSGGRLGYVHIKSMNDDSFRDMYAAALGRFNDCDGLIVDTRCNGGGRLHEDVEIFLSGEKYLTQVVRGKVACDMPSRRWNKPSIMLQCESNYSNAHGTPWVYSHMKIGKTVGMPVPGTMTTVSWETLQDPTLIFGIPVVGYRQDNGVYLEGCQLEPDILVANKPETIVKGEDLQLRTAVEELLRQIDGK